MALKEFQGLYLNKIVFIATDKTRVVAYINKERGMTSGALYALLWRILTWCSRKLVTLKARHIPGRLNVIADKLSRLGLPSRVVPPFRDLPGDLLPVGPASGGPFCHLVQQIASICITSSRPPSMGSGCSQSARRIWTHMPPHRYPF